MRALCDSCESAPATVFCAADEAALCRACDEKVHLCNKLASRHIRVGLANPSDVPQCDICENAPAFFYCDVDGSSLCLQCDTVVHVGGKRTHKRYLVLRQRVEFPGDKPGSLDDPAPPATDGGETKRQQNQPPKVTEGENRKNDRHSADPDDVVDEHNETDSKMIDLNMKPLWIPGQASNDQVRLHCLINWIYNGCGSFLKNSSKATLPNNGSLGQFGIGTSSRSSCSSTVWNFCV